MDPIPLPAPLGGVNERVPIIVVQSPQCEVLLNFNVTEAGIELRHGDSKLYKFTATPSTDVLVPLLSVNYQDSKLIVLVYNSTLTKHQFYDAVTGTLIYTQSSTSVSANYFQVVVFNRYIFFTTYQGLAPGYVYDGSTITTIGYVAADGGSFLPYGGNAYKNRCYLIEQGTCEYLYSEIEAISGDMQRVDLSSLTEEVTELSIITSITVADNVSSILFQCFVFKNGEVIFYSGSYPDSTDWTEIGRAKIGKPLNIDSYLRYQGDTLILCDSGVWSLKDMFLKGGSDAASLTLTAPVWKSWTDLVNIIPNTDFFTKNIVNSVYDIKNRRIIISFRYSIDTSTGLISNNPYFFIYNVDLQSWFFHLSNNLTTGVGDSAFSDMIYFDNKVVMLTYENSSGSVVTIKHKEGATGFTDRNALDNTELPFIYEVISPPIANGRLYVQKVEGMDVIQKTDLQNETEYQFIRDFGVTTTIAQKTFGSLTTLQKPFINTGLEGSYVQYKISGITSTGKTVGLSVYGVNVWIENGRSPR